jgi:hypothetical protein
MMDSVESANRWHQWSVKGSGDVLTQVLDHLDANLPHGWKRLSEKELESLQSSGRPGSAWYSFETTPSYPGVTLGVERINDSELRGGRVFWFELPFNPPTGTTNIPVNWEQIMRFLDEGIVPAAKSAGASVRVPTVADMFLGDLPLDVAEQLRMFSRSSRKALPLNRDEAEGWRTFVIGVFRARAVIEGKRLVEWLTHEGWPGEAARELNLRLFDQCLLLSRYAEEVSAA